MHHFHLLQCRRGLNDVMMFQNTLNLDVWSLIFSSIFSFALKINSQGKSLWCSYNIWLHYDAYLITYYQITFFNFRFLISCKDCIILTFSCKEFYFHLQEINFILKKDFLKISILLLCNPLQFVLFLYLHYATMQDEH